jgi:hypothetical protein
MRAYGTVLPRFWTGGTGKRLRGHKEAQIVAFHLMTGPSTTMTGVFNLALPTLCHETGLTEVEARLGLKRLQEEGFALCDEAEELMWVPSLARIQLGEELKVSANGKADHRVAAVRRAIAPFRAHPFYSEFLNRYGGPYKLLSESQEAPSKPLPECAKAPLKGPDPDHAPDPDPDPGGDHDPGEHEGRDSDNPPPASEPPAPEPPPLPELAEKSKLWADERDLQLASIEAPRPETWPECVFLETVRAQTFKVTPQQLRHWPDPRVKAMLERFAENYSVEQLAKAIRGAALDDHVQRNPQFQTLHNILKNAAQVDRFMAIADKPPKPKPANPRHGPVQQGGTDPFARHREHQ